MKEKTARAIIFLDEKKDAIITIKREKYKDGKVVKLYYTLPGGHVEGNETYEETLKREIDEELGINISIEELFLKIYNQDLDRYEEFYTCKHSSGKIGTGTGPEWQNIDLERYGSYEIVNIKINELEKYNLLPVDIKNKIIEIYKK